VTDSTTPGWRRQLRWFNDLTAEGAVGALLLVCHSRGWAEQVAARRPYTDLDALQAAADEVWMSLSPQDWLEALDAHPRIGERGGASSAWSRQEQEKVGEAGGDVQAAVAQGNREYEERFGHVFLISAAGRPAEEILANLRDRMGNDPDTEVRVAAEEHRRITRLRVERLMQG
jgi:OHCU decarboxylase